MKSNFPVLFILGPTGVGKSAFALNLAESLCGQIVNADSVQAYARVQIGAAKPTLEEIRRVPHHLIGIIEPPKIYTAGDFRRDALEVLKKIESSGSGPALVVGGSGFYLQALESGMYESGKVPESVRLQLASEANSNLPALYEELRSVDQESALRIHSHDAYRIQRALEIWRHYGVSATQMKQSFQPSPFPYRKLKLGLTLEREALRDRITHRTQQMLEEGLVDEVQSLLSLGLGDWAPLRTVGYREVVEYLRGQLSRSDLQEAIVTSTMQLAKKQMTWFRRDPEIHWYSADRDVVSASRSAEDFVLQILDT